MLVWINGPFEGGKTATAYELNRRLPGSVVATRSMSASACAACCRLRCGETSRICRPGGTASWNLLRLTLAGYDGPVIVPMTLVDSGYFSAECAVQMPSVSPEP
jgi:hypothetical protein